ncbi:hypothetical protein F5X97DRAFT_148646 [Nemania serpens]|nr:hypothetical protein F5X97DRAFT_148646 [Nemania serpens]
MTAADDSGSLLAGAGSLDSTIGDSRVVRPIHETVTEFFLYSDYPMKGAGRRFVLEGHLCIMSTCLAYIRITELDGLIEARKRHGARGRGNSVDGAQKNSYRCSRSVTSFMSSASSRSRKYRFQDTDDEDLKDCLDDTSPKLSTSAGPTTDHDHNADAKDLRYSTPEEFPALFPTMNRLHIQHNNLSSDSDMNLRVHIVNVEQQDEVIQLFYFEILDLSTRQFSLRRYRHDSGDEVSYSWRGGSYAHNSRTSGTILLDMKSDTEIEIKYDTTQGRKGYRFIYREVEYEWRVEYRNHVMLYLSRDSDGEISMAIMDAESREDNDLKAGHLVPPCSMWLTNEIGLEDPNIANVIVATGLTVLVDNSVRHRRTRDYLELLDQKQDTISLWTNQKADRTRHSVAGSIASQTLEDYPALTSYALNRVFVHARAALARGDNRPWEVLRKLVLEGCWHRWDLLQEHFERSRTWEDLLMAQRLDPWILAGRAVARTVSA